MLSWSLIFFILAVVAGLLGFTGIAASMAGIAKTLFFIFIAMLVVSLIMGLLRPGRGR